MKRKTIATRRLFRRRRDARRIFQIKLFTLYEYIYGGREGERVRVRVCVYVRVLL